MTEGLEPPKWPDAVGSARLAAWMDGQSLEQGDLGEFEHLTGGTQNLIVSFRRGARRFVLRRPPLVPRADGDHTIMREARVLRALESSRVPHPRFIAACDDLGVIGAAFYLMEPVAGFNPSGKPLPPPYANDPSWRGGLGFAMVDALLALGEIDPVSVGLADFGKPETFLERQVPRWLAHLETYASMSGWPGPASLTGVDELGRRLEATRPQRFTPGLLHGDFHLANVMAANDKPAVAAVIDWELATFGDPLLDLGWLVATWPDSSGHGAGTIHVTPWDGFPSAKELVDCYAAASSRDLSRIDWYVSLASYKLAILLEASHARSCAGRASQEIGARHHTSAMRLIQSGLGKLDKQG